MYKHGLSTDISNKQDLGNRCNTWCTYTWYTHDFGLVLRTMIKLLRFCIGFGVHRLFQKCIISQIANQKNHDLLFHPIKIEPKYPPVCFQYSHSFGVIQPTSMPLIPAGTFHLFINMSSNCRWCSFIMHMVHISFERMITLANYTFCCVNVRTN